MLSPRSSHLRRVTALVAALLVTVPARPLPGPESIRRGLSQSVGDACSREAMAGRGLFMRRALGSFMPMRQAVSGLVATALAIPSVLWASTGAHVQAAVHAATTLGTLPTAVDLVTPTHVIIEKGWTLSRYAEVYHTTVEALRALNPTTILDPHWIYAGQPLTVPVVDRVIVPMPALPLPSMMHSPIPLPPMPEFWGISLDTWSSMGTMAAWLLAGMIASLLLFSVFSRWKASSARASLLVGAPLTMVAWLLVGQGGTPLPPRPAMPPEPPVVMEPLAPVSAPDLPPTERFKRSSLRTAATPAAARPEALPNAPEWTWPSSADSALVGIPLPVDPAPPMSAPSAPEAVPVERRLEDVTPVESRPSVVASSGKSYLNVKGQLMAMGPGRRSVVVDHEAISGLMPAMTMTYTVDPALLTGFTPTQRVRFTLQVVGGDQFRITHLQEDATPLPGATARLPRTPEQIKSSLGIEPTWERVQDRLSDLADRRQQDAQARAALRQSQLGGSLQVGAGLRLQTGGLRQIGPHLSGRVAQPFSRLARHDVARARTLDQATVEAETRRSVYAQAQASLERALLLEQGLLEGTVMAAWDRWIDTLEVEAPEPSEAAVTLHEALLHASSEIESAHRSRGSKLLPARWQGAVSLWPFAWAIMPEWDLAGRYAPDLEAEALEGAYARWQEAQFLALLDVQSALERLRAASGLRPTPFVRQDTPAGREAQVTLWRQELEDRLLLRAWRVSPTSSALEAEARVREAFDSQGAVLWSFSRDTAQYLRDQKVRENERRLLASLERVAGSPSDPPSAFDARMAALGAPRLAARDPERPRAVSVEAMAGAGGMSGSSIDEDPRSPAMGSGSTSGAAGAAWTVESHPRSARVDAAALNQARQTLARAATDRVWNERWVTWRSDGLDVQMLPGLIRVWRQEADLLSAQVDVDHRLPVVRARLTEWDSRLAQARARLAQGGQPWQDRPLVVGASWQKARAAYDTAVLEQQQVRRQASSWTGQAMARADSGAFSPMGRIRLDQWLTRPLVSGVRKLLHKNPQTVQDRQAQLHVRAAVWDGLSDYYHVFVERETARAEKDGWDRQVQALREAVQEAEATPDLPGTIRARLESEWQEAQRAQAQAQLRAETAAAEDRAWDALLEEGGPAARVEWRRWVMQVREGWPAAWDPPPSYALKQKQKDIEAFQATLSGVAGATDVFAARMKGPMAEWSSGLSVSGQWNPVSAHNRAMAWQRDVAVLDQEAFEARQTSLREREVAVAQAEAWKGLSIALHALARQEGLSPVERYRTQALAIAYDRRSMTTSLQAGGPWTVRAMATDDPLRQLTVRSENRAEFAEYVAYHCPCTDCQTPLAGVDERTREMEISAYAGPVASGVAVDGRVWTLYDAGRRRTLQTEWVKARQLRTWKSADNAQGMQDRINGFFAVQDAAHARALDTAERLRTASLDQPEQVRQALVDYFTARGDLAGANAGLNRDVVEILKALLPDEISEVQWTEETVPAFVWSPPLEALSVPDRSWISPDSIAQWVHDHVTPVMPPSPALTPFHPQWPLKTLEGRSLTLSALKGKVVIINVWATWCAPCVAEMESLERLRQAFQGDPDIAFVMVSEETPDQIRAFLNRHPHALPFYTTTSSALKALGLVGYPTTFILSKSGERVQTMTGARTWDTQAQIERLRRLLRDPSPAGATPVSIPTPRTLGRSA